MIIKYQGFIGKVGKINKKINDIVDKDDIIISIETKKGNKFIKSPLKGIILNIFINENDEVKPNVDLFEIKELNNNLNDDYKLDLLIIGGGPGGYVSSIYAAKKGFKVTLVEKDKLGGTCLNVGCIPTKSLVKSSLVYKEIKNSNLFGIECDNYNINMKEVIKNKDNIVNNLLSGIDTLMNKNNIQVIKGICKFKDDNHVEINNKIYSFNNCIIATGSKINNFININNNKILDSTKALNDTNLVKSITIIGGGVIGLEFAFIYNNLGVKVNVIECQENILNFLDEDIRKELYDICIKRGINVITNGYVNEIKEINDFELNINIKHKNNIINIISNKVLLATGRIPNLDDLNLNNTNIKYDKKIYVDDNLKTNIDNIYAIGDVTNIMQLAHVASHQGIYVINHLLNIKNNLKNNKKINYYEVPNVIFTDPEIAMIGYSEDYCIKNNISYKTSKFHFSSNGKALTLHEEEGFIKLIMDKNTHKIIGGSIIGPDASNLISTLTLIIKKGLTDKEINETIFAHPTISEVIHEASLGLSIGSLHE